MPGRDDDLTRRGARVRDFDAERSADVLEVGRCAYLVPEHGLGLSERLLGLDEAYERGAKRGDQAARAAVLDQARALLGEIDVRRREPDGREAPAREFPDEASSTCCAPSRSVPPSRPMPRQPRFARFGSCSTSAMTSGGRVRLRLPRSLAAGFGIRRGGARAACAGLGARARGPGLARPARPTPATSPLMLL